MMPGGWLRGPLARESAELGGDGSTALSSGMLATGGWQVTMTGMISPQPNEAATLRNTQPDIPAGEFSIWLRAAREALLNGTGTDVECGECTACCSSSYFIHIKPDEMQTLARINKKALAAAPGMPQGHLMMGYDKDGLCPMLIAEKCSIYAHRPQTCRNYDCRLLAAADVSAGEDKPRINQRVQRWKFSYPTQFDHDEHAAVKAAAKFIRDHATNFPGGKVPQDPNQLAVLAVKVYKVFLEKQRRSDGETVEAVVKASREFDSKRWK